MQTGHDVLKDQMLADQLRLQSALDIKTPTVDKVVTQGDELTLTRLSVGEGKTVGPVACPVASRFIIGKGQ